MKTIVKTRNGRATVEPLFIAGEVQLSLVSWTAALSAITLTADEAGALIFGLEQAVEAMEIRGKLLRHQAMAEDT